jgi:hypothetical protein
VKRVCESCLVVDLCRAWAMSQPEPLVGIWGGLTENERRKLRAAPAMPHPSANNDGAPRRAAAPGRSNSQPHQSQWTLADRADRTLSFLVDRAECLSDGGSD